MLAHPFHTPTNSRVSVHEPIQPRFRTIDGVSIRFAESERNGTQNSDALSAEPLPGEPVRIRADVVATGGNDTPGRNRPSRVWPVRTKGCADVAAGCGRIHHSRCFNHPHIVGPGVGTAAALFAAAAQPDRFLSLVVGSGGTVVPNSTGRHLTRAGVCAGPRTLSVDRGTPARRARTPDAQALCTQRYRSRGLFGFVRGRSLRGVDPLRAVGSNEARNTPRCPAANSNARADHCRQQRQGGSACQRRVFAQTLAAQPTSSDRLGPFSVGRRR